MLSTDVDVLREKDEKQEEAELSLQCIARR